MNRGKRAAALGLVGVLAAAAPARVWAEDTFAPLELYNGSWAVQSAAGKVDHLENHCSRTGLFFVCEQVLNGKSKALVVFLLEGEVGKSRTYRTKIITPDSAATPAAWNHLTIEGERWVYGAAVDDDAKHPLRARTINEFSGADRIHFEVQTSRDGKIWTTTASGDERRETPSK